MKSLDTISVPKDFPEFCWGVFEQLACYTMRYQESDLHLGLYSSLTSANNLKSVSMRKPGRTRQGVIMLKSPISLKLGTNVRYQELTYVTEFQIKILNSLGDPGIPCKTRHFARFMHN